MNYINFILKKSSTIQNPNWDLSLSLYFIIYIFFVKT